MCRKSSVILIFVHVYLVNAWVFTEVTYNPKLNYLEDLEDQYEVPLEDQSEIPLDEIFFAENPDIRAEFGQERFSLIYPGTKWCGAGDVADSYDDLGPARETDVCCREHDHCPDVMRAGESRHNLTNTSYFTRLSCECDETFRRCLHEANTTTANRVGLLYFDAIGTKCFREDYPVTGCARKGGWFNKKCIDYSYDNSSSKLYQWFDVPTYKY